MKTRIKIRIVAAFLALFLATLVALHATSLEPLRAHCSISADGDSSKWNLHIYDKDCEGDQHCGHNFSNELSSRFTGITIGDLAREGAQLAATLSGEPGTFTCSGTVHDHELSGTSLFTPSEAFVQKMDRMGFRGFDSDKLQAYTLFGIDSAWVQSLQQSSVQGLNIDNLLALRIFKADAAYIRALTSLGYPTPDADKLVALKVQGVNPEEVRRIRALGYQPNLDELIQIRIFHVTPDFIQRMRDRGFKDLTISKLVQIRIFKLDE